MEGSIEQLAPYSMEQYEAALWPIFEELNTQPTLSTAEKVQYISQHFLGKPYLGGALGEGPEARFDQSPIYRTDAFDCLTFVNTVLALLHSTDVTEFKRQLIQLNYFERIPQYQKRFHFMSSEWNIENAKQNVIKDVTVDLLKSYDQSDAPISTTTIDKPNWFLKRSNQDIKQLKPLSSSIVETLLDELHAFSKQCKAENASIHYIPFKKLFSEDGRANLFLFAKIEPGSIIEIVRPNWALRDKIGTNLNVSHLGFALYVGNQLMLRHASTIQKKVVDEPLLSYLREHCLPNKTIAGINVQAVV